MTESKKKRPSAKTKKKLPIEVEVVECPHSKGGPCAMEIASSELLSAAFAKIKWEHRENTLQEFIIDNVYLDRDELGDYKFFVNISSTDKEIQETIQLKEFLISFLPCGEIGFEEMH